MTERQKAINFADHWFSKYIRARDVNCTTCGSYQSLECGHLFTRAYLSIRWNERNAACQCHICNSFHEVDPEPLKCVISEKFGKSSLLELQRLSRKVVKMNVDQIWDIGKDYRTRVQSFDSW